MKANIHKDQYGIQISCDGAHCYDLNTDEQLKAIRSAIDEYFATQQTTAPGHHAT
jgi:hypothetical protein